MQRDVEQKLKLYLYDSRDIPQIQAYLKNTEGSVPDHHNKESITIKQAIIFLLQGSLALHLWKTQPLWSTIKWSAIKWGMPVMTWVAMSDGVCYLLMCRNQNDGSTVTMLNNYFWVQIMDKAPEPTLQNSKY